MSYILDALKKAEHQRDLGQVPGIGTEHQEVTTGVSRWVYFLLIVVVVNAGLLVYALWPEPRSQTDQVAELSGPAGSLATPQKSPALKPSTVKPRTGPQASLPAKEARQAPGQARPTPAASSPPPVLPEVAKQVVDEPARRSAGASRQQASLPAEATRQTRATPPPAVPRPLPAAVKPAVTEPPASPAGASRQPASLPAEATRQTPAAATPPPPVALRPLPAAAEPATESPGSPAGASGQQASAGATRQASAATATAPATLRPLPPLPEVTKPAVTASAPAATTAKTSAAADRNNNLPVWPQVSGQLFREVNSSLNLDVHVYSEHPQERFVLINMQKYNEGETLQEGPVVDEITLGGVILSFHGQRFRVQAQ